MVLHNKAYDIMKWVVAIVLPAFAFVPLAVMPSLLPQHLLQEQYAVNLYVPKGSYSGMSSNLTVVSSTSVVVSCETNVVSSVVDSATVLISATVVSLALSCLSIMFDKVMVMHKAANADNKILLFIIKTSYFNEYLQ